MLAPLREGNKMAKFCYVAVISYLNTRQKYCICFSLSCLKSENKRLRYASTLKLEAADFSETLLPIKVHIRYQKTIMSLLR